MEVADFGQLVKAIFLSALTTYVREERLITVAEVEQALGGSFDWILVLNRT